MAVKSVSIRIEEEMLEKIGYVADYEGRSVNSHILVLVRDNIRAFEAELIKERGISKNKLSQRAEMQRTQLNNYCNNKITRLDVDVLARLCTVLECGIGDILEFVPPEEK